ncbi:30S ribosomal protein S9 [Candidatus Roizmanbacteria bacterium]|nr:30S ribosomal protein S9 [Candidatus Roizmanbacteria bacterium]
MPKKTKNLKYYEAVGKRKEAVARVRLFIAGKDKTVTVNGLKIKAGEIFVNKKLLSSVFPSLSEKNQYLLPLKLTQNLDRFAIAILVKGGGKNGQLNAITHGLSRAIVKVDKENYRSILKKHGLLTRDARIRERRKVGTGGKARRKKQSPKR